MNRVATMSVVRGEGECLVIVNNVVQKEITRLQRIEREKLEAEKEQMAKAMRKLKGECTAARQSRNRLLGEKMRELNEGKIRRMRFKYKVSMSFGWVMATLTALVLRVRGKSI